MRTTIAALALALVSFSASAETLQERIAPCLACHGGKDTGQGRNSPLASILPNVAAEYPALFPGVAPGLVFIEKVRHGQFFQVGGNMPFFSKEALSDDDLGALLTYLGQQ